MTLRRVYFQTEHRLMTELSKGVPVLNELLNITNAKKIIAIGEKARLQCRKTGIDAPTVRHPANGGAGKFREQIIKVING